MFAAIAGGKDGAGFAEHPAVLLISEQHPREPSIQFFGVQKYLAPRDAAIIGVEKIRASFVGFQFEQVTLRQQPAVSAVGKVNISK